MFPAIIIVVWNNTSSLYHAVGYLGNLTSHVTITCRVPPHAVQYPVSCASGPPLPPCSRAVWTSYWTQLEDTTPPNTSPFPRGYTRASWLSGTALSIRSRSSQLTTMGLSSSSLNPVMQMKVCGDLQMHSLHNILITISVSVVGCHYGNVFVYNSCNVCFVVLPVEIWSCTSLPSCAGCSLF